MKLILLVILILGFSYADINDGLIAHYRLNGQLSSETGHGDATNVGATLATDRFGNPDSAYQLSNNEEVINIPNDTINGLFDYTIAIWLKADDLGTVRAIYSLSHDLGGKNYYIYLCNNLLTLTSAKNSWNWKQWQPGSLWNGNWQHTVMSRSISENKYKVWIDGVQQYDIDTTVIEDGTAVDTDGFVLGNIQTNAIYGGYRAHTQFIGSFSDLRIYDRAFTTADAEELYNAESRSFDKQTCVDYLAELLPGTITEDLTFPLNESENEYYHHYDIQFNEFTYDANCFDTQVWLGSNLLSHEVDNNGIIITFPWKDAETWGCEQLSSTVQQCQFQVHVYFDGTLQHKKLFTSTITTPDLDNLTQELSLNVINDEDESLKSFDQTIDTQLQFCDDIQCSNYISPSEIIRNTDVFVEFKVNTPGYNKYYPVHSRLTLNEFNVDIQNQAAIDTWDQQGKIVYHFRPPFASSNIVLAIGISLSKNNPNNRLRRALQETESDVLNNDLLVEEKDNVGKYIRINVIDIQDQDKTGGDKKEQEGDDLPLIIGIVAGVVVLAVSLTGVLVYFKLKSAKQSSANKYKEQSQNQEKLSDKQDNEQKCENKA